MPTIRLPSDPSFENLKKQAKSLQKAVRARDEQAAALVKEFHPHAEAAAAADGFTLSDAQLVIARHYGFPSWAKLKHQLSVITHYSWVPSKDAFKDPVDEFIRLACLDYENDHVTRHEKARQIFHEHPEYARQNICAAATAGDVDAVRSMLVREPNLARTRGGPHDWEPLLYACYSRLNLTAPHFSTLESARLLLANGADPNAGFLWRGLHSPFTALTGAFGEGENGRHQPPHQHCLALARLLLEAGADPNDSQTLYNRHFKRNDDYLHLLFEHGLGKDKNGPWFKRLGDYLPAPAALIAEEVWNAAKLNYLERVKLLIKHGVACDKPGQRDGRTPCETALRSGNKEVADYLLKHGAKKIAMPPAQALAAACVAGDREKVLAMLKKDPRLLDKLSAKERAESLASAAEGRKLEGIRLMAELGFDLNAMVFCTPLHQAAHTGHLELVKLLIELGADPCVHERSYNATPLGWAAHNDQPAVIAFLMPLADIFDAVVFDLVERLQALLKKNPALANARDPLGHTPLHWLNANVKRGVESIELLVAHGTDVNARNHKGETALDKLIAVGRSDLADLLRRHGAKPGGR